MIVLTNVTLLVGITLNVTWTPLDQNTVNVSLIVTGATKVDFLINDKQKICSDGHLFNKTGYFCNRTSLSFAMQPSSVSRTMVKPSNNGVIYDGWFNITVKPDPTTIAAPLTTVSQILSTKRHYYLLPIALIPPAWFIVLIIYYVNPSE